MSKPFWMVGVIILLLAQTLSAQQWGDWASAANNPNIAYRVQLFADSKVCYLEVKDQQQGEGPTNLGLAVDYLSTKTAYDNEPAQKTMTAQITTTAGHNGTVRIPNCFAVSEVRTTSVHRQ